MVKKLSGIALTVLLMIAFVITCTSTAYAKTALKITKQPVSVTVAKKSSAKTTVSVKGDGLKYKWYYKDKDSSKFRLSDNFKSNYYSIKMTAGRNGRQVYCVITDKYGSKIKTKTVTLKMRTALKITKQPSSVYAVSGDTAKVSFKVKGDGLKYKWYYKDKDSSKFRLSDNFKSNYYSIKMTANRNGRQVYCVITDKYGKSVKTKTVTLRMKTALKITKQPSSVYAVSGAKANVSFKATGDGLKYKWYYKDKDSSKFRSTDTFKSNSYSVEMNKSRNGRQIYCLITDKYGSKVKTKTVTLSLKTPLEITKQPSSVTAVSGDTAKVSFKVKGDGLSYKWYFKDAGSKTFSLTTTFKSTSYSVTMNKDRSARQIYCVITDKYGSSVKTKTVTLNMGTPLAITRQPYSALAAKGEDVITTFEAQGEGLTYKWYYKDTDSSKFSSTSTFTSNYYTTEMSASRSGRQLYCLVTDKFGSSVKTDVVTIKTGTPAIITIQPASVSTAEGATAETYIGAAGSGITYKWYHKVPGKAAFTLASGFTGNTYSVKMSDAADGSRVYCVVTDKNGYSVQTTTATLSMKPAFTITADLGYGDPLVVGVRKDGKYTLSKPSRPGYTFKGWQTLAGSSFAASGTISSNVSVKAVWTLDNTDSLKELIERTNGGATEILITGNITIDQPIYISHDVTIYSNKDYTLKRDPNYSGDLFVVGQDAKGVSALLHHRKAVLTLGGGKGTLTIDGNRDNMKVNVVGSAIFAGDSSTVNLYDGVCICNNLKLGNERFLTYTESSSEEMISRAGGGAILINNSTVNMYGGIIDNNGVKTEHTVVTDAQGVETKLETDGCGGAIFNNGVFYMYGGTISNNQALRGGAVYAARPLYLVAGTIQGNKSYTYGGAVSSSSSINVNIYVGSEEAGSTMLFKDNTSVSAGGALYSNTASPIVILGNTVFEGNRSDYSGGAIYTGGSLVVKGAVFRDNHSYYSGGAVYFHNTKDSEWQPREAEFTDCVFESNTASLGGAVTFSRSNKSDPKAVGIKASIDGCKFIKNSAVKTADNPGNGGAIYITQMADVTLKDCEFTENTAVTSGGAVSIHSQANVKLSDSAFSKNTAVNGGALYLSSNTTVKLSDLTLTENKAIASETGTNGNGGAIYGYLTDVTVSKLDIRNNSAFQHGGAVYLNATTLTMSEDSVIEGNSAGDHGGAFYLTYTTNQDGSRTGSKLILNGTQVKSNTAKTGGAISIRTDCEAVLDGAELTENSATATVDDVMGGGAVYVGYGKLSLTYVTMDKNTSAYYGGAIFSRDSDVTIEGGSVTGSEGATGSALHFRENTVAKLSNVTVAENNSTANGVVYINGGSLEMNSITAENNNAYNGGVLYASGASTVIGITDSTFSNNSASSNGGCIFINKPTLTVKNSTFTENTARLGGAVYNTLGIMTTESTAFTNNSAVKSSSGSGGNGGAVSLAGGTYTVSESDTFTENTAENHAGAVYVSYYTDETDETKRTGGVLTVTGASFTGNTAMGGGAVSIRTDGEASFDGTVFTGNAVTGDDGKVDGYGEGGGAVYVGYGKLTLNNVTATGNTAEHNGGAVHVLDSECTVNGGTYKDNTSASGGAFQTVVSSDLTVNSATFTGNNSSATESDGKIGGGAINISAGTLNVTDSLFDGNSSGYYGGAILSEKSTVEIKSSKVTNSAGTTGAALYIRNNSTVTVKDSEIADNTAKLNGVVYCNLSNLTMNNVPARGNKAVNGGVIYTSGSSTVVGVENSEWTENNATSGGAVYMTGAAVNIKNSTLESNTSYYGGAVYSDRGTLTTESVTFSKNSVAFTDSEKGGNGGAMYLAGGTYTASDSDMFTDNTAVGHAGAIYVCYYTDETDGSKLGAEINVPASTFTGNTAATGGAVSIRTNGVANFTGTVFTGNIASSEEKGEGGGAVYVGYGTLTLDGTVMKENSTGFYGGAVSAIDAVVDVKNKAVFENNHGETGTAMQIREGGTATFSNVELINNKATAGGNGTVYITSAGTLTMTDVTASGNENANGGVIYASGTANVTLSKSTFDKNNATGNGGAIAYNAAGKLELSEVTFTGNTAKYGGAIFTNNANAELTFTDCSFTENSAVNGGAVYTENASTSVVRTSMSKNTSTLGGAIYNRLGTLTLTEAEFTENSATRNASGGNGNGGAISLGGGSVSGTATFRKNTAENHAGGIYLSYTKVDDKDTPSAANITASEFSENTAMGGGAVSIRSGCSGIFENVTFTDNSVSGYIDDGDETTVDNNGDGEGGGAIYVGYGSVTLNNVTATGNKSVDTFGGFLDSVKSEVTVTGGSYTDNKAMAGGAFYGIADSQITITDATVSDNESTYENTDYNTSMGGGAVAIKGGTLTVSGTALKGNAADYYGGTVLANGTTVTINNNTEVSESSAGTGAALYFRGGSKVTITDSAITDNTSSANGVVYQNGGTLDMTDVTANGNTAKSGGVLFASGSSTVVTLKDSTWSGNSANYGGAINFENATVTLAGATLTENTALLGGAVYNKGGTLNTDNTVFTKNTATKDSSEGNGNGGAVYLNGGTMNGSETTSLTENTAENHGGAVYVAYINNDDGTKTGGVLNMTGGLFENNTAFAGGAISSRTAGTVNLTGTTLKSNQATSPYSGSAGGGAIYSNDNTLTLSGVTLDGNTTGYYGGAVYAISVKAQIKDGTVIKNNSGVTGAALCIYSSSTFTLDSSEVTGNNSSSNGAIYINGGSLEMKNLTVSGNQGNNGGVVYASGSSQVTVNGGTYTENTAKNGGGIFDWRSKGGLTVSNASFTKNTAKNGGVISAAQAAEFTSCTFSENSATNGGAVYATGAVTLSGCSITKNTAAEKGGAIFATGSTADVSVKDSSVLSENTATYGGAVYMEQDAVVNIDSSTMELNTASDGGAVYVAETAKESISATLNLNGATVKNNSATSLGGGIYVLSNGASITNSTFEANTSILGGAIHNRLGEITSSGTTFTGNTAVLDANEKNGNGGAITVVGGTYTSSGNDVFTRNSAAGHAGAVYSTYVTNEGADNTPGILNIGASAFTDNTAVSGGALSVRTGCEANVTGATFTGNSASGTESNSGGGAIYVGWGSVTVNACTFDGNSSGFYGAALTAPGSEVSISNGTEFKNNTGATGTAVYIRDGGSGTLTDVKLTDNIGTGGNGTVYITGNGTLNMTNVTATGNKNSNGAVVYASGSAKVNLTGGTFSGNTAKSLGGVLDMRTSGPVVISGGTFSGNTANKGGMLHATGKSVNVTVENAAQIKENTASTGGAIFMDLGATVTVKNSTLDGNSSTKDGGAIHVADTGTEAASATELILNSTTLQNNSSAARGGALATDASSTALIIKATDCTFYKNTSTTSGGAVSVQNGNCNSASDPTEVPIVFTNCTFRENKSTTDGGALDLRSGSCLKIDGITAETNSATGNAGVIYVTSNNTRLYITGEINCTGNTTSKSGKFSYLYNNSYSNPPKIYTTHSNTAAWYADVAGNKTNVVFDLASLP